MYAHVQSGAGPYMTLHVSSYICTCMYIQIHTRLAGSFLRTLGDLYQEGTIQIPIGKVCIQPWKFQGLTSLIRF